MTARVTKAQAAGLAAQALRYGYFDHGAEGL